MALISIVSGCYNEEENIGELHERVAKVIATLPQHEFEIIFIDNCSKDRTVDLLKEIAQRDKRVRIIVNSRNFGPVRSGYYVLLQSRGDAVIGLASDLQDPPEMIVDFVRKWEEGYKVVMAQKLSSQESPVFFFVRRAYYYIARKLADIDLVDNVTGFGLYDRVVIDNLRKMDDPYPYFRGLVCEIGFPRALIPFEQPCRKRGITKNNFYTLYDMAMLGITSHSKVPLRLATMSGFAMAGFSLLVALVYFVYKLLFWNNFQVGVAPLVIGIFFFSAVQLFFIGVLGEYIGMIHTQIVHRPLVVEKERVNFDLPRGGATDATDSSIATSGDWTPGFERDAEAALMIGGRA